MEKEIFGAHSHLGWNASSMSEMDSVLSDHLQHPGFLSVGMGWEPQQHSMEQQTSQFDSAYSSIVSSPSNPAPTHLTDTAVIHELIGRLGSICNSGEISPQFHHWGNGSTNTSCYSTPLDSPPKLNLSMMEQFPQARAPALPVQANLLPLQQTTHFTLLPTDHGFAERAARFTSLGTRNYPGSIHDQFPVAETGNLSRASSSKSLRTGSQMTVQGKPMLSTSSTPTPDDGCQESISQQVVAAGESATLNARKRKTANRGKTKDAAVTPIAKDPPKLVEDEDATAKKTKSTEQTSTGKGGEVKPKLELSDSGSSGDNSQKLNTKPPEPPKQDYIHVRARRGQATDSHSLAERVRREKISERMKFLQNLVPGCNKVTGKAVMLDEIINYVQSLQRQVEFLSMKLATVNPRLDFNIENALHEDMQHPHGSLAHSGFPVDVQPPTLPFPQQTPHGGAPSLQNMLNAAGMDTHCPVNPLTCSLGRTQSMQLPTLDGIGTDSQVCRWSHSGGDDLHSVIQMRFVQDQDASFSSQPLQGALHMANMKISL